jgi:uncharacterized membrane protein
MKEDLHLKPLPADGGRPRLDSIDLLRGLVMVIMALDHVRDFFHNAFLSKPPIDPVDLGHTTPVLFLTRWITHFCAPTFVFLAGTGAFLYGARGKTKRELSWFLVTRGLWLVVLEMTLVRFGWNFNLDYPKEFGGGVIWAIGWSMVVMSVLVFLPTWIVAVVGLLLVALHNTLDGLSAQDVHLPELLWMVLHSPNRLVLFQEFKLGPFTMPTLHFVTGYSLLPWLGVMASGYGFGALFLLPRSERRKRLFALGIAVCALFVIVRFVNFYGDPISADPTAQANPGKFPGPWAVQENPWFTLFSFLNCQKYPPSLCFVLMTLGPAIIFLAIFDRDLGPISSFFITFGRVPLFYYLLHIPLIHGLMVIGDYLRFGFSPYGTEAPWTIGGKTLPEGYGYDLPIVYAVWASVVLLLYPLCRWYAGVKKRSRSAWLSYL